MRAANPLGLGAPASIARASASAVSLLLDGMAVRCGAPFNLRVMREPGGEDRHVAHASIGELDGQPWGYPTVRVNCQN